MAVDCEPYSSPSFARSPPISDGDDSGMVLGNVEEHRLGEVKMVQRRVAPAAGGVGKGVIGRTEIGGGDQNRAWKTPLRVVHALDLIARPAAQPIVEQGSANSGGVPTEPLTVQIPIPTSSACSQDSSISLIPKCRNILHVNFV